MVRSLGEVSIVHGPYESFTRWHTRGYREKQAAIPSELRPSAHPLRAGLRNIRLFRRSDLQQRLTSYMDKAQLAGREQRVDGFFHPRPRNEVGQKVLHFALIHG